MAITLAQSSSLAYTGTNNFPNSIDVQVFKIDTDNYVNGTPPVIDQYVLGPVAQTVLTTETFGFTLPEDGVYQIRVNDLSKADNDVTKYTSYIIFSYCDLRTCLTSVIQSILCQEDECDECIQTDKEALNRLIAVSFSYFMYIQSEFGGFNTVFESLDGYYDTAKLQELFNIQDNLLFMKRQCQAINNCGEATNQSSGCGCD